MRYSDIWPRYAKYWDTMTVNPASVPEFEREARVALANKDIYLRISDSTQSKIPWAMIACLHRRESDANFATYLGNGQSLAVRTTEVPIGRGPFCPEASLTDYLTQRREHGEVQPSQSDMLNAFVAGALDAVRVEGWGAITDWRLEKVLYYMLLFNGIGSEAWAHPSSYIWGGTNIQQPGKWIRDHVWSNTVEDPQPGCAPLLQTISRLDPTVVFARES
jgi:lysozyme family protein